MSEMEEKLGAILNNPQMMQQIMSMAQAMNQATPKEKPKEPPQEKRDDPTPPSFPDIDLSMLQRISGFARQGGIDANQQALLSALSPYLSRDRVTKLEKAMRAAKMAKFASAFLNSGGLQLLTGR